MTNRSGDAAGRDSLERGAYDAEFFGAISPESRRSADEVVPLLMDLLAPRSVVDVGCGTGTWLASFMAHGVADVRGIDGDWVPPGSLQIPQDCFVTADLKEPFRAERSFDLAISLEVAEHLPPAFADVFVSSLTALAPVVLFSAAIPHQSGTNHVNEQWPEYWAGRFRQQGFAPVDCIRAQVWDNPRVQHWYAQNAILYVSERARRDMPSLASLPAAGHDRVRSLVHPRQYLQVVAERNASYGARRSLRGVARRLLRDRILGTR